MKVLRSSIAIAPLVLLPPLIASIFYLAPQKHGLQCFWENYPYIAGPALIWCLFALFLKRRTVIAGLLGMHAMMAWFIYAMWKNWSDDLGWLLYLPDLFIGAIVAISISVFARMVNEWVHQLWPGSLSLIRHRLRTLGYLSRSIPSERKAQSKAL